LSKENVTTFIYLKLSENLRTAAFVFYIKISMMTHSSITA